MNGSRRPFPRPFIPLLHGEKRQAAPNLAAAVRGERCIKALCRGPAPERGGGGEGIKRGMADRLPPARRQDSQLCCAMFLHSPCDVSSTPVMEIGTCRLSKGRHTQT